jgi:UDP:flavonoid glycosyltransferase YjiC (YdhE family)
MVLVRSPLQSRVPNHLPSHLSTNTRRPSLVLYTSSHGFGHAVRCAGLCRALLNLSPELRVVVRTMAPAWIFPEGVQVEACAIDVGVVQPHSLEIDARATLERYAERLPAEAAIIDAEAERVRRLGARAVVADVPSAAFEIAARAGLPGIALANFSWDWIYEPFVEQVPVHAPLIEHIRAQYQQATLLLRLPFNDGLDVFPTSEDVPLLARRSRADRADTRRRLGLPLDAPLVLFSFGGHASAGMQADGLAALPDYAFVATSAEAGSTGAAVRNGENLFLVPPLDDKYVDLLAACDAVITKPGYGIVADVIANRVPALYVSRAGFREEPVLVRALEAEARAVPLDRAALDTLDLRPSLERLAALDRPWAERRLDGAEVAARRILELAGL